MPSHLVRIVAVVFSLYGLLAVAAGLAGLVPHLLVYLAEHLT